MSKPMRYRFEEVRRALDEHWGLRLARGSRVDTRDGRWDTSHSRTGFIVSGEIPGRGYGHVRYTTLVEIVRHCDLAKVIAKHRA